MIRAWTYERVADHHLEEHLFVQCIAAGNNTAKPWKCARAHTHTKKSFEMVNIPQSIVNAAISCLRKLSRKWAFVHVDIS